MEMPNSSSTPVKEVLDTEHLNHSVDDLLQVINNNLSTSSLNLQNEGDKTADYNGLLNTSDDNPITPLKWKHSGSPLSPQINHKLDNKPISKSLPCSPVKETDDDHVVMQDIPRAPSFDELEFNTKLNRVSSITRVCGPRQLANSTLSRTLSGSVGRSSSFKLSRDSSPSKKSVCFDQSPPKILEYPEPKTPNLSDDSVGDDNDTENGLNPQWDLKLKSHTLPPPLPKHQIVSVSPPLKDTTLGSSDEDTNDYSLTKEELMSQSVTLQEKLDLVLGTDEVSKRVQEDEVNRGSGSPGKPTLSNKEAEFILNIKTKKQLEEDNQLRDASKMFEVDLVNRDKDSTVLRLDPQLRRKSSNESLRDEERQLVTTVVAKSTTPIVLKDGLKHADLNNLPQNSDAVSVQESFSSATDVFESEPLVTTTTTTQALPSMDSHISISTIQEDDKQHIESTPKTHKKKLSLSESISSFISSFTKSPRKPSPTKSFDDKDVSVTIPGELPDFGSEPTDRLLENTADVSRTGDGLAEEASSLEPMPVEQPIEKEPIEISDVTMDLLAESSSLSLPKLFNEVSELDSSNAVESVEHVEHVEPVARLQPSPFIESSINNNTSSTKMNDLDEPVAITESVTGNAPNEGVQSVSTIEPVNSITPVECMVNKSIATTSDTNVDNHNDMESLPESESETAEPDTSPINNSEVSALLKNTSPISEAADLLDDFMVEPAQLLRVESHNGSFADEFRETGLYNSSDNMDQSYRSLSMSVKRDDFLKDLHTTEDIHKAEPGESNIIMESIDVEEIGNVTDEQECSDRQIEDDLSQEEPDVAELDNTEITNANSDNNNTDEAALSITESKENVPSQESSDVLPREFTSDNMTFEPQSTQRSESQVGHEVSVQLSPSKMANSFAVQTTPMVKEVSVQTDDVDSYRSLEPSVYGSAKSVQLPTFNSTLFHDKPPKEDSVSSPPTSFIEIWHNQPKAVIPEPQYRLDGKKVPAPSNLLKVLSVRRTNDEYYENTTLDSSFIKTEPISRRASLEIPRPFVAKSVSRSSYINMDSKRSSMALDSSFNIDNSGVDLPNISDSSDFGAAFQEWDVSKNEEDFEAKLAELQTIPNDREVKAIWGSLGGSTTTSTRASPPVDSDGRFQQLLDTKLGVGNVKSSSALGGVVVANTEDAGVTIEYDRNDSFASDIYAKQFSNSLVATVKSRIEPKLVETPPRHVIKTDKSITVPRVDKQKENKRFISGSSEASGFDLSDDFNRVVQLQDSKYVTHQHQEMIVAKSNSYEDDEQQHEPSAPEPTSETSLLDYAKQRSSRPRQPSGPRVRTPLVALDEKDVNRVSSMPRRKPPLEMVTQYPESKPADVSALKVKKRSSRGNITVGDELRLPSDDKGRLYIHVNSLLISNLKEIKQHKATFKLYLDNGKHTISTPKMDLNNVVVIDKEFELAVEEDVTELYFTLKVSYQRPDNELVDVYKKIPLNNPNRFSKLFGSKPKYRVEKGYETRKRVNDDWDNRFATDGSFGKNKINFYVQDNQITSKTRDYTVELFNEWETQVQNGVEYKKPPHAIGKIEATMLYIPRTSPLENLPPSIKIAQAVADHVLEQSNIKFEGYLFQEGGDCELWKRRFFTIQGTSMVAHTEDTRKPRAQINLLKVVEVIYSGKKRLPHQRNVTEDVLITDGFKLKFKNGEVINFNADTSQLKSEWIRVLEKIVDLNRLHQPWVMKLNEARAQ